MSERLVQYVPPQLVSAGFVVLGLLLLSLDARSALAAFPGRNGNIAYSASIDRGSCSEKPDCVDARVRILTRGTGRVVPVPSCQRSEAFDCDDERPAWAPGGERLAFVRIDPAGGETLITRSRGQRIVRRVGTGSSPAWSPTARRFASVSGEFSRQGCCFFREDLVVTSVKGSGGSRRLTFRGGRSPAWSSRNLIAFERTRGGVTDLYTIRPDGSRLLRVTRGGGTQPDWSPNGRRLVFVRSQRNRKGFLVDQLATTSAKGGPVRQLTWRGASTPVWSPDGEKIAFTRGRRLMVMSLKSPHRPRTVAWGGSLGFVGIDWQALPSSG